MHKKVTTYNLQFTTCKKGFTLMEILIAAAIFASVMIIATGVLAESAAYRAKLKTMKETSEESRMLADMLTRDIRSANGNAKIALCSDVTCTKNFKNGLAIIKYHPQLIIPQPLWQHMYNNAWGDLYDPTAGTGRFLNGNVLIIAVDNEYKIYYSSNGTAASNPNSEIYYFTLPIQQTLNPDNILNGISAGNIISSNNTSTNINFAGLAPDDSSSNKQQPIIEFFIASRTKDYSTLQPNVRAEAKIKSAVTGRSYNY